MPSFIGAARGSTTERGYGWADHQLPKRQAFAMLPEWSPCCRCGQTMWKFARETYRTRRGVRTRSALHYDHNDARTGYLGWSHAGCNLKAGARRGGLVALARRRARHSRAW